MANLKIIQKPEVFTILMIDKNWFVLIVLKQSTLIN